MTTFEQRAQSAGAALRAAFLDDTSEGDSMSPTTTAGPSTQPTGAGPASAFPPRRRRSSRPLAAAAALVLAGTVGAIAAVTSGDDDSDRLTPAEPAPAPSVLQGLRDVPEFPIAMTVPPTLREVDEDPGSRAFDATEPPVNSGGVLITALRSVDGVDAAALPADITTLFADRDDVQVSDVGQTTVAGVTGQSFTLTVAEGARYPRDVWCPIQEQLCFKLDPDKTMDVVVLPTAPAPLWIAVEYTPDAQDEVEAAARQLLGSLRL